MNKSPSIFRAVILLTSLLLSGCINIATELQPANPAVQPILTGKDCTPIILGIGIGTNQFAVAQQAAARHYNARKAGQIQPIRNIHVTRMTDTNLLGLVGQRCIEVLGEP